MHCTNGIVIQLPEQQRRNVTVSTRQADARKEVTKRRSFNALPTALVPYVSKNKEGPTHLLGNEFLEERLLLLISYGFFCIINAARTGQNSWCRIGLVLIT